MLLLLLSLALAGVPDETWTAVEGQVVVLVNPQGKQIRGTIVRYEGDRVVLERESDGRTVVVLRHEVSSVILVEKAPEPEEPVSPEGPGTVKEAVVGAGGLVKEAGEEVLEGVRPVKDPEVVEVEEVVEVVADEPVLPLEDTVVVAEADIPAISDTVVTEVVVVEGGEGPVEPADEPLDGPVIIDTVIVSEPAAPSGAELTSSPIPVGRSYGEGLRAGREAAGSEQVLGAFAGGLCGTAAMAVVPCAFNPLLGCMTGVVAATASPAAAYLIDPTPPIEDLPDDETEFSRGYVEGYTAELRRRRLVMAAIGSGAGLLVGGTTGFVVWSVNQP